MTNDQTKQVKAAAKTAFGNATGVRGLGVNDEAIVVFVEDHVGAARLPKNLPVTLDDGTRVEWPVQAIVTGKIISAAPSTSDPSIGPWADHTRPGYEPFWRRMLNGAEVARAWRGPHDIRWTWQITSDRVQRDWNDEDGDPLDWAFGLPLDAYGYAETQEAAHAAADKALVKWHPDARPDAT